MEYLIGLAYILIQIMRQGKKTVYINTTEP
jgi:hypothetical protein